MFLPSALASESGPVKIVTADWYHTKSSPGEHSLPLKAAQLEHKEGTSPQLSPSVTDMFPVSLTLRCHSLSQHIMTMTNCSAADSQSVWAWNSVMLLDLFTFICNIGHKLDTKHVNMAPLEPENTKLRSFVTFHETFQHLLVLVKTPRLLVPFANDGRLHHSPFSSSSCSELLRWFENNFLSLEGGALNPGNLTPSYLVTCQEASCSKERIVRHRDVSCNLIIHILHVEH